MKMKLRKKMIRELSQLINPRRIFVLAAFLNLFFGCFR